MSLPISRERIEDAVSRADRIASDFPLTISRQLAQFAARFEYGAIPQAVIERAKVLILDAVGIALASTQYDFSRRMFEGLRALSGGAECSIIGMAEHLALRDAVLLNGALIHGLDYDDSHLRGVVHPTSSLLACALGVCEQLDRSGRDLLAAYVLGMETIARIGAAAKGRFHHVGFHPTGLVAHFACALQAGWLYGLTADQLAMAQGAAGSTAAGSQEFLEEGAWNKRLHPGWAAVGGITVASLARAGFIGPSKPYEGRYGLYKSHLGEHARHVDYQEITAGLGDVWELANVAIKPYPICGEIHACADSALALREQHDLRPQQIAKVTALVSEHGLHTVSEPVERKVRPDNAYAVQFSVQYVVATCLARGRFGLAELEAQARGDAEVLALAQKVEAAVDPDSLYPKYRSGGVIVHTVDGRELRHHEAINRGAAERALTSAEIERKYCDNAALAVSARRVEQIRDVVLNIEKHTAREVAHTLAGR